MSRGYVAALCAAYDEEGPHGALRVLRAQTVTTPGGCWEWQRGKGSGYGRVFGVTIPGAEGNWQAQRLSYYLSTTDLHHAEAVHHKCANRACINPAHLEKSTHRQNIGEMMARRALEARISELSAALWEMIAEHGDPRAHLR